MIQIGFTLRQDFIAQELCVNRDNPKMKCGGFCYLSKKMHESEKDDIDRKNIANLQVALALHYFRNPFYFPEPTSHDTSRIVSPTVGLVPGTSVAMFRPPQNNLI